MSFNNVTPVWAVLRETWDDNPIAVHRPDEWALYQPLRGMRMLELGGKWCSQAGVTYKSVFEKLGYEHVSVDWNGQHGALIRDLRKPLDLGQFDMVCNFGTTEHVSDQEGVWRNIHNSCRVGGVYVGQTPHSDGRNWWWHGEWYAKGGDGEPGFFEAFAELNGWQIERLYTDRPEPFKNLYCRMVKTEDREFAMPDLALIKYNKRRGRHDVPPGCARP